MKGLEKRKPERSAVVVVFAGGREFSTGLYQPLIDGLKARGTALHVLTVGSTTPPDMQTTEGRNRELLFDRGTSETGGRRQNVLSSMATADALETLAANCSDSTASPTPGPTRWSRPGQDRGAVRPAGLTARGILIPQRPAAK